MPFGLTVGVTGHRADAIGVAGLARVCEALDACLAALAAEAARVHADEREWFAPGPAHLALLSPLADGADQLAAEAALTAGWELKAILPFPRADYLADIHDPAARAAATTLLDRSACVLELPGDRAHPREAYLMAGRATIAHCDVLLAVWDGLPARGRGGTGEVVAHALARGTPVIHLPLDPNEAPAILWSGFDPHVVTTPHNAHRASCPFEPDALAKLLRSALAPTASPVERAFLRSFTAERERRWTPRIEYPLLLALTGVRGLRRNGLRAQPYLQGAASEWSAFHQGCLAFGGVEAELQALEAAYAWSDRLATHYAQTYRSGHVFNFVLGAAAVLTALTVLLVPAVKLPFAFLELFLILAVIANTAIGTGRGWHRRWLDYRQLAERLRPMRSLKLLGLAAPDLPASTEPPRWIDWYAAAVWRATGLPSGVIPPDRPPVLAAALAEHELRPQIAYHRASAAQVHRLDHRLHLLGTGLFVATVLGCVLLIACYALAPAWTARNGAIFVFLSAGLPAVGTALFGIRTQGDFAATAHRSQATAQRLERIAAELEAVDDLPRAGDLFEQAARAMLSELGEWRLAHHQRELALP